MRWQKSPEAPPEAIQSNRGVAASRGGSKHGENIDPFNSLCPDVDALTSLGFHKLQPWTSQQPFSDLASVPLVSTSSRTLHMSILSGESPEALPEAVQTRSWCFASSGGGDLWSLRHMLTLVYPRPCVDFLEAKHCQQLSLPACSFSDRVLQFPPWHRSFWWDVVYSFIAGPVHTPGHVIP